MRGIQTTDHSLWVELRLRFCLFFLLCKMQNSILCVVKENRASRARGSKSDTKINGNIFLFLLVLSSTTNSDSLPVNQSWCEVVDSKQAEEQWQQLVRCRLPATATEDSSNERLIISVASVSHQHHSTMWSSPLDEFTERWRHRIAFGPWQLPLQNWRDVVVRRRFGDEVFGG